MSAKRIKIEIWSDIMCPYCYLGKKAYNKALESFEHQELISVEWKAFELNPKIPKGKVYTLREYFDEYYGMPEGKVNAMLRNLQSISDTLGVPNGMEQALVANTRDAHRLIKLATEQGKGDKMAELLSEAYFVNGLNYGDAGVLTDLGVQAGLNAEEITALLKSDRFNYEVIQDVHEAANLGIDTVPFFLFNRTLGVRGSEPVDIYVKTLNDAYKKLFKEEEKEKDMSVKEGQSCSLDGVCS